MMLLRLHVGSSQAKKEGIWSDFRLPKDLQRRQGIVPPDCSWRMFGKTFIILMKRRKTHPGFFRVCQIPSLSLRWGYNL
eukprot:scaffold9027_cov107-Cylindrotheca_fusiformis.AAC.2